MLPQLAADVGGFTLDPVSLLPLPSIVTVAAAALAAPPNPFPPIDPRPPASGWSIASLLSHPSPSPLAPMALSTLASATGGDSATQILAIYTKYNVPAPSSALLASWQSDIAGGLSLAAVDSQVREWAIRNGTYSSLSNPTLTAVSSKTVSGSTPTLTSTPANALPTTAQQTVTTAQTGTGLDNKKLLLLAAAALAVWLLA